MNTKSIHIFYDDSGKLKSVSARIFVDGIGEIHIDKCVSSESAQNLSTEVCNALKVKLGQTLNK
jgi:hypothetical protein